jgi:hypothetical protein
MLKLDVNRLEFLKITAGADAALAIPTLKRIHGRRFPALRWPTATPKAEAVE